MLEGVDVTQQDSSVGKSLVTGSFLSPMDDDLSGGENENENTRRPSCVGHDGGEVDAEVRLIFSLLGVGILDGKPGAYFMSSCILLVFLR